MLEKNFFTQNVRYFHGEIIVNALSLSFSLSLQCAMIRISVALNIGEDFYKMLFTHKIREYFVLSCMLYL